MPPADMLETESSTRTMEQDLSQPTGQKRKLSEEGNDVNDSLGQEITGPAKKIRKVRNATAWTVQKWRRCIVGGEARLSKLQKAMDAATDAREIDEISKSVADLISHMEGHQRLLQMYEQLHSQQQPCTDADTTSIPVRQSKEVAPLELPELQTSSDMARSPSSAIMPTAEKAAKYANFNASDTTHNAALSSKQIANSSRQRTQTLNESNDAISSSSSQQKALISKHTVKEYCPLHKRPRYVYDPYGLWLCDVRCTGLFIGVNAARRAQVERESLTKIIICPRNNPRYPSRNGYKLCRILGNKHGILKARCIIEKLLGYGIPGGLERKRLDEAAQMYAAKQQTVSVRPTSSQSSNKASDVNEPAPGLAGRLLEQAQGKCPHDSKASPLSLQSRTRTETQVKDDVERRLPVQQKSTSTAHTPPRTPKLERFILAESDEESSSSSSDGDSQDSSDDDSESSSDDDSEGETEAQPVNILRSPVAHHGMTPAASDGRTARINERIVIKIEDDTEDEDPVAVQPSETSRHENDWSSIPTHGTMRVSEVERMLELRDAKAAQLSQRVKILEYALHYKGVTDFQITRMHAQVGEKGNWNAKFAEILGEPRKGNEQDGGPLPLAVRRHRQDGNTGSRRAS